MLHTRTGRRLAQAGWIFMIPIIMLNLAMAVDERAAEAFKLLLSWPLIGGLWFIDWRRIARRLTRSRSTPSARHCERRQVIRERGDAYALDGNRPVAKARTGVSSTSL